MDAKMLGNAIACSYCGFYHSATCPRVKAIEYHENGLIKRIEFYETSRIDAAIEISRTGQPHVRGRAVLWRK
jgi:hypothetical protein